MSNNFLPEFRSNAGTTSTVKFTVHTEHQMQVVGAEDWIMDTLSASGSYDLPRTENLKEPDENI